MTQLESTRALSQGGSARIAVVGAGKMGEAMIGGWIGAAAGVAAPWSASTFVAVEPSEERRAYLAGTYGIECVADISQLSAVDLVVLAVKPQVMMDIIAVVPQLPQLAGALFLSIAAGMSTQKIESALPAGAHLVRAMPNIALLVGQGTVTLCPGSCATDADVALAKDMFDCIGSAFVVEEGLMDVTCALNGSGPAYAAALVEAMAAAGAEAGLDYALAEQLSVATLAGTGALMQQTQRSATQTRIDVSSPGGTTLAALGAMEQGGFTPAVKDGVAAAITRSKELGA